MKKILAVLAVVALAGCDSLEYEIALDGMCDDAFGAGEVICNCVRHELSRTDTSPEFQSAFVALMNGDLLGLDSDAAEEVSLTLAKLYMECGAAGLGLLGL